MVSVDQEKAGTVGTFKGFGYAVGLNDCDELASSRDFSISFFTIYNNSI